ncbi:hypothetical protein AMTRI_Chr09g20390 [Amborella trichopoda]
MRTLCDACEGAPAIFFCAADEAALCRACDNKVHMCNKLASRHVRVRLADPSDVPRCDICENSPAFFYCEIDGSSLCLQCDMAVHVGGKRTHERYLLLRQRVEFIGDKPTPIEDHAWQPMEKVEYKRDQNMLPHLMMNREGPKENNINHQGPRVPTYDSNANNDKHDAKLIDLNARPHRNQGQPSNSSQKSSGMDTANNRDCASLVPVGSFKREVARNSVADAKDVDM